MDLCIGRRCEALAWGFPSFGVDFFRLTARTQKMVFGTGSVGPRGLGDSASPSKGLGDLHDAGKEV